MISHQAQTTHLHSMPETKVYPRKICKAGGVYSGQGQQLRGIENTALPSSDFASLRGFYLSLKSSDC